MENILKITTRIFAGFILLILLIECSENKTEKNRVEKIQAISEKKYVDTAILLDYSWSMWSKDFDSTRFNASQKLVEKIIQNKDKQQKYSVIFCSGESFISSPLTNDKNILMNAARVLQKQSYIDNLFPTNDSGNAILEGIATLRNSMAQKNIIFFTDGDIISEDNWDTSKKKSEFNKATQIAMDLGITLNAVLMRPDNYETAITMMTADGDFVYKKRPVKPLDSLLIKACKKTGGTYTIIRNQQEAKQFNMKKFLTTTESLSFAKNKARINFSKYNTELNEAEKKSDSIIHVIEGY